MFERRSARLVTWLPSSVLDEADARLWLASEVELAGAESGLPKSVGHLQVELAVHRQLTQADLLDLGR
jgi:hypothetical protein